MRFMYNICPISLSRYSTSLTCSISIDINSPIFVNNSSIFFLLRLLILLYVPFWTISSL